MSFVKEILIEATFTCLPCKSQQLLKPFSKKSKSKVFKVSNEFLSFLLDYRNPSFRPNGVSPSHPPLPQLRIAEKKRIKRINEDDDGEDPPQQVTGSDLSSVGVRFSYIFFGNGFMFLFQKYVFKFWNILTPLSSPLCPHIVSE